MCAPSLMQKNCNTIQNPDDICREKPLGTALDYILSGELLGEIER
jgi:hypothetical protein